MEEKQKQHLIDMMQKDEELRLYDIFNDEKKQGVKELIDKHTLEEASWKFNPLKKLDGEFLRHAFIQGAKWQQERMYSEEDLRKAFTDGQDNMDYSETYGWSSKLTEQEWFEQYYKIK